MATTLIKGKSGRPPLPTLPKIWRYVMKTQMSRFHIHDDLTAPEGSLPGPQGRARSAGQLPELPRRPGRLARRAARLRALPLRAAPRHARRSPRSSGSRSPSPSTTAREPGHRDPQAHRAPGRPRHRRGRARARVGLRRPARGRAAALPQARSSSTAAAPRCTSTRRRARPAGATSSCSRRSRCVALESFTAMVNVAGEVPVDGSVEETRACCARRRLEPMAAARRTRSGRRGHAGAPGRRLLPRLHEAVELDRQALDGRDRRRAARGRRDALLARSRSAIPQLSDRLLSERMKELEARGIVERQRACRTPRRGSSTS